MSAIFRLYRFFDDAGTLLYVGRTINPGRRFAKHADTKPWWSAVCRVDLETFANHEDLVVAEKRAIRAERPVHNIRLNGRSHPEREALEGEARGGVACLGMRVGGVYALALIHDDGSRECPVGIVIDGDDSGVVLTLFDWLCCSFSGHDEFVHVNDIVRWRRAEEMTDRHKRSEGWDPKLTVFEMQPLGDFQTRWLETPTKTTVTA